VALRRLRLVAACADRKISRVSCAMSKEPFALSTVPPAPAAERDYDAIFAAVMDSARGRWFLHEFARRNRNADTTLLLEAIARIETVIRGDRSRESTQNFRIDLLEMARAIAETRAEVAEIKPEPAAQAEAAQPIEAAGPAPSPGGDVFAAAERMQDFVWAMRERGLDPATCAQIEELATSILSASSLHDPNDHRAERLCAVLRSLERRINMMLEAVAATEKSADMPPVADAPPQAAPAEDALPTGAAEVDDHDGMTVAHAAAAPEAAWPPAELAWPLAETSSPFESIGEKFSPDEAAAGTLAREAAADAPATGSGTEPPQEPIVGLFEGAQAEPASLDASPADAPLEPEREWASGTDSSPSADAAGIDLDPLQVTLAVELAAQAPAAELEQLPAEVAPAFDTTVRAAALDALDITPLVPAKIKLAEAESEPPAEWQLDPPAVQPAPTPAANTPEAPAEAAPVLAVAVAETAVEPAPAIEQPIQEDVDRPTAAATAERPGLLPVVELHSPHPAVPSETVASAEPVAPAEPAATMEDAMLAIRVALTCAAQPDLPAERTDVALAAAQRPPTPSSAGESEEMAGPRSEPADAVLELERALLALDAEQMQDVALRVTSSPPVLETTEFRPAEPAPHSQLEADAMPPRPASSDPLAALKAMSDEERIALFT
jgi:hypothetical protein